MAKKLFLAVWYLSFSGCFALIFFKAHQNNSEAPYRKFREKQPNLHVDQADFCFKRLNMISQTLKISFRNL